MWNRVVLCGTREYCVGQQSHIEQRSLRMGQNIIIWDRAVSYGIEQSNVEQNNQKWNRAVPNGT